MSASTLAAMAEAVEKAAVVVMLVAAEYKQSEACRTEGESLCLFGLCLFVSWWLLLFAGIVPFFFFNLLSLIVSPVRLLACRRICLQSAQEDHSHQGAAQLPRRRMARYVDENNRIFLWRINVKNDKFLVCARFLTVFFLPHPTSGAMLGTKLYFTCGPDPTDSELFVISQRRKRKK